MSDSDDTPVTRAMIQEAISSIAEDLLEQSKNQSPTLSPSNSNDSRITHRITGEWIDGETVDLEEWR